MIATPVLTTSRLLLRPLELADHEQAQRLFGQWEVVRYLQNQVPWPYPPDGAYTFYRDIALPADGTRRSVALDHASEDCTRSDDWKHQRDEGGYR